MVDRIDMGRDTLIEKADEYKDFVTGDDGFVVFWPTENHGAYSAWMLRSLADELDKRNHVWEKVIAELFS